MPNKRQTNYYLLSNFPFEGISVDVFDKLKDARKEFKTQISYIENGIITGMILLSGKIIDAYITIKQ